MGSGDYATAVSFKDFFIKHWREHPLLAPKVQEGGTQVSRKARQRMRVSHLARAHATISCLEFRPDLQLPFSPSLH